MEISCPISRSSLYFEAAIKSYAQTATGTTDVNGQFSLTIQVPSGAGYLTYNNANLVYTLL
nr:hypothetical protein [Bacillus pumilus]